jgi:hypothetical protein
LLVQGDRSKTFHFTNRFENVPLVYCLLHLLISFLGIADCEVLLVAHLTEVLTLIREVVDSIVVALLVKTI